MKEQKVVFTVIRGQEGKALKKELGENVKFMKHDVTNLSEWNRLDDQ
ncbi:hypothetical protein [Alteribacillus sp. YIM 98480]|nr:hypothetical protein [Alteribacillus sp. YIM 98480]